MLHQIGLKCNTPIDYELHYQILEVLIVGCGHEMSSEAGAFMQSRREEGR